MVLAGCQTTGDPNRGGLFGWSEDKAQLRQTDLAATQAQVQQRVADEKARGAQLQSQQGQLNAETVRLQADVDRLLGENAKLERDLRALMAQRGVSGAELARLQQVLKTNERARSAAAPLGANPGGRAPAVLSAQSVSVNTQNQQLQREVLILLQR